MPLASTVSYTSWATCCLVSPAGRAESVRHGLRRCASCVASAGMCAQRRVWRHHGITSLRRGPQQPRRRTPPAVTLAVPPRQDLPAVMLALPSRQTHRCPCQSLWHPQRAGPCAPASGTPKGHWLTPQANMLLIKAAAVSCNQPRTGCLCAAAPCKCRTGQASTPKFPCSV